MWWYNLLGDNKGIIPHLLRIDPINTGFILLTNNLAALKSENPYSILLSETPEWRTFVGFFGLII